MSTSFPGGRMYYTVDGNEPSSVSTPYTGPFLITSSKTIRAIAYAYDFSQSALSSTLVVNIVSGAPTFHVDGEQVTSSPVLRTGPASITMTTPFLQGVIFYTLDGAAPTTNSTRYNGAFTITSSKTIKAIAYKWDYSIFESGVPFEVQIDSGIPVFYIDGIEPLTSSVTRFREATISMSSTFPNGRIYYTLDGSIPFATSTRYTGAFTVTSNVTLNAVAFSVDGSRWARAAAVAVQIVQNEPQIFIDGKTPPAAPIVRPAQASISMVTAFPNGSIFYTLDGSVPSTASTRYTGAFTITSTKTIRAVSYASDFSQSQENQLEVEIAPAVLLTVMPVLASSGSVSVSPPPINGRYASNTVVTLTANPETGWSFSHWSGALGSIDNPVTFTLNGDKSVFANFGAMVTILPATHGEVRAGRDLHNVPANSTVLLTAIPDRGYYFSAWGDDASGSVSPNSFKITKANPRISASFLPTPSNNVTLTAYAEPATGGRVEVSSRWGAPAQSIYDKGEQRLITAVPNAGWAFAGWGGDLNGLENPALVTLDSSKRIAANFEPGVSVNIVVSDGGTVTRAPDQLVYPQNSTAQFEARPLPGFTFVGWSGSFASTENPIAVTITNDLSLHAKFSPTFRSSSWMLTVTSAPVRGIAADAAGNAVVVSRTYVAKALPNGQIAWNVFLHPRAPEQYPYPGEQYDVLVDRENNAYIPNWGGAPDRGGYVTAVSKVSPDGSLIADFNVGGAAETISLSGDGAIYAPARAFPFFNPPTDWLQALGATTWRYLESFPSNIPDFPNYNKFSRPAIDINGRLYLSSLGPTNAIVCLDAAGQFRWRFVGERGTTTAPHAPIVARNTVYAIDGSGRLVALSASDGSLLWHFRTAEYLQTPSVGPGGILYLGSKDSPNLYAINPDGTIRWVRRPGKAPYGIPAIGADGTIYVTDADSLHALDQNGNRLWEFSNGNRLFDPIIAGANLYTADQNQLIAIAANAAGPANSPWPMIDATQFADARERTFDADPLIYPSEIGVQGDGFHLTIHGQPGATIKVYQSIDLENWTLLHQETTATGDVTFIDPLAPAGIRFYSRTMTGQKDKRRIAVLLRRDRAIWKRRVQRGKCSGIARGRR